MNDRPHDRSRPTAALGAAAPGTPGDGPLPPPCAVFRGRLSGYLDGELAGPDRLEADTHVAACPDCRRLADEIESAERVLAAGVDDDAATPLPEGFTGTILARTVHEAPTANVRPAASAFVDAPPRGSAPSLGPWLGWVAAAAMVVFNLSLLNLDGSRPSPSFDRTGERSPAMVPASWQVSSTLQAPASDFPVASWSGDPGVLHATATLLEGLAAEDPPEGAARFAASVIQYDELLPRLAALARTLPPEPAATVELTRGLLEEVASADPRSLPRVRARLSAGDLAPALRRLESRLGGSI